MTSTDEKARRIKELYDRVLGDPNYRSAAMGDVFVPGKGSIGDGAIVFIGEAPGREEEKARAPFVGPAGRNLNSLLEGIGLPRGDVYVTNLVKYRPMTPEGDNRNPSPGESMRALPYLLEELKILKPSLIVCLGLSSAKALLGDPALKMGQANGTFYEKHGFNILVTYHPSPYNYRIPDKKEAMVQAFRRLREAAARR